MVGIFGRSNKSPSARPSRSSTDVTRPVTSPPPPYNDSGHEPGRDRALFTTETTTTTHVVTTTTQTTHFFSLPLFRRRVQVESPDAIRHPSMGQLDAPSDEHGVLNSPANPVVLLRDKELPPTPPLSEELLTVQRPGPAGVTTRQHSPEVLPISQPAVDLDPNTTGSVSQSSVPLGVTAGPSSGELSTHPTIALARAALGLGLPPVMLNTSSAATSSSDLNTISFTTAANPSTPPLSRSSTSVMRRVKSFHKDADTSSNPSLTDVRERRRTRGLSLGPLFSSDSKGKERQHELEPDQRPPLPKSLTRKASFWSRIRKDSHTPSPITLPLPNEPPRSSLPSLQPVSPFYVDSNAPSSLPPDNDSHQSSDLRRRHSERGPISPASSEFPHSVSIDSDTSHSKPSLSLRRRRPRRPQTADASEMLRSVSSFHPGTPLPTTSSPTPIPPTAARHISPRSAAEPRSNTEVMRPRAQTNPPLLHRLSLNIFGSPSSPSPSPSPIVSNPSGSFLVDSPPSSLPGSARPSLSKPSSRPSPRPSLEIPQPRQMEESPEVYLHRLTEAVSKAEVANVLASSADGFHIRALRAYIDRFDFSTDPLDVALRRLLMDVGLPRETQQIDRVMEAFAARYVQCHPNLFTSDDHPYVLAFSLIMLHTDAFNKSNKRKMTKPDYIKNTRLPGVLPEVLDCFYDNIIFAPFIFIEDPLDINGQRGLVPEATSTRRLSTLNTHSPGGLNNSGSTLLGKGTKIDPYFLITHNLLDELRVHVQSFVPLTSPYFYQGTAGSWDEDELLRAFAMASVIEVRAPDSGYYPAPWFSLGVSGGPGPMSVGGSLPPAYPPGPDAFSLKVTKVGLLMRKDDVLEGGRRAMNRKWKEWSVLLTGSQLLLSRDPSWAAAIQARANLTNGELSMSHPLIPKPDELLSMKDAVAVFDKSYTKYHNALRLVLLDGRHILLKASDEHEMNCWIARINYASAFKTAGVRMRSLGMSGRDIELTGQAAAASHLRDVQYRQNIPPSPRVLTWGERPSTDLDLSGRRNMALARGPSSPRPPSFASSRMRAGSVDSGSDDPATPSIEHSARILKATFDLVKEELATGHWGSFDETSVRPFSRPRALSLESSLGSSSPSFKQGEHEVPRMSSRSKIIRSKVHDLQSKISLAQNQLDSDMRFVRNIAVLTPFQRATRERLHTAVQNISKRIMQVRLDMEKLVCHRDVLSRDLIAEERDWQRTKKMALRAATAKLQEQPAPRMTLSVYMDTSDGPSLPIPIPRHERASPSGQAGSSASGSFYSAVGANAEWAARPLSDDHGDVSIDILDGQVPPEGRASSSSCSFADSPDRPRASTLTAESSFESTSTAAVHDDQRPNYGHEKYYTASETPEEQAEEWDKTRAAKRVSLVRLPSDLRMSVLFGKHVSNGNPSISEDTQIPSSPSTRSTRSSTFSSITTPYTQTNNTLETVAMLGL